MLRWPLGFLALPLLMTVTLPFAWAAKPPFGQVQFTPGDKNQSSIDFASTGLDVLRVQNSSGRTTISPSPTLKVYIAYDKKAYPANCHMSFAHGTASELNAMIEGTGCEVDLDIKVPQHLALDVRTGSGALEIRGLKGELKFESQSGAVSAHGKFTKIDGRSHTGAVEIQGLTTGQLNSGSGAVHLKFLPDVEGKFSVKSESGPVEVLFAKGSKLRTDLSTGTGVVDSDFYNYTRADFTLEAHTETGPLQLKEY